MHATHAKADPLARLPLIWPSCQRPAMILLGECENGRGGGRGLCSGMGKVDSMLVHADLKFQMEKIAEVREGGGGGG